jgi:hypothetical protein
MELQFSTLYENNDNLRTTIETTTLDEVITDRL